MHEPYDAILLMLGSKNEGQVAINCSATMIPVLE